MLGALEDPIEEYIGGISSHCPRSLVLRPKLLQ